MAEGSEGRKVNVRQSLRPGQHCSILTLVLQTNLFRSILQTCYPTLEVDWAVLLSYFPPYKFNITDNLIGLTGGNSPSVVLTQDNQHSPDYSWIWLPAMSLDVIPLL